MRILITGAAGFVGAHVGKALLERGHDVVGLDSLEPYYDLGLKRARLSLLSASSRFRFVTADIADPAALRSSLPDARFEVIVHFGAQAGVRYALENPGAYTRSNLVGHHNMLELARGMSGLGQLIYASSSSVYGNDTKPPYSEAARADRPVSYYGATKRAGELLSHSYAELFGIRQTGLRFFTLYGPWGRPDMAYWLFTEAILRGKPVKLFGRGLLKRDFTWIDDVVPAIVRMAETLFVQPEAGAPHRLYNLGNSRPEEVRTLVREIEAATGKTADIHYAEGPPGDVKETCADISRAARDFGFQPATALSEGIPRFVDWFRSYHRM